MAAIHDTDHNLLSPPSPQSSFQVMTVNAGSCKGLCKYFSTTELFSRMYSPKWHDISPQGYGWNGATRWGSPGRPSNPQPLPDSRQAEISVVLQSFKKKKTKTGQLLPNVSPGSTVLQCQESLCLSRTRPNLIAGSCQWFNLVLFILLVLARRCFPWVRELVRSLSKQETGLFFFFFKLGTLTIQLFLIKSKVHVVL